MKPWQVNLISLAVTLGVVGVAAGLIYLLVVFIDPIMNAIAYAAPYLAGAVVLFWVFLFVRHQLLNSRWFRR